MKDFGSRREGVRHRSVSRWYGLRFCWFIALHLAIIVLGSRIKHLQYVWDVILCHCVYVIYGHSDKGPAKIYWAGTMASFREYSTENSSTSVFFSDEKVVASLFSFKGFKVSGDITLYFYSCVSYRTKTVYCLTFFGIRWLFWGLWWIQIFTGVHLGKHNLVVYTPTNWKEFQHGCIDCTNGEPNLHTTLGMVVVVSLLNSLGVTINSITKIGMILRKPSIARFNLC